MLDNRDLFECYVDGDFGAHIRNQIFMDGRRESWATEAELYAASSLYRINIKLTQKLGTKINWITHTFRNADNSITYDQSVYLILKNSHFNILNRTQDGQNMEVNYTSEKNDNECIESDWFDQEDKGTKFRTLESSSIERESSTNDGTDNTNKPVTQKASGRDGSRTLPANSDSKGSNTELDTRMNEDHNKEKEVIVTNLSTHSLTETHISLLSKGLKFIPDNTKLDNIKLLADLSEWERRMRLCEFFHDIESDKAEDLLMEDPLQKFKVHKKSTFTPPKGRYVRLDLYIEMVKNDIVNSLKKVGKLNVTKEEQNAFKSLLHNEDIVIRPADKGSGIVVLDKTNYINSLQKEMEESDSYTESESDLTHASMKEVKKLVNSMSRDGAITKDMKQYLLHRYPKAGALKGNPKLHKKNAPMRTIVNGMNTPTEKLAEFAEHELDEFVKSSPSYIRDTSDFINRLKEIKSTIPEDTLLFCFDVLIV